MRARTALYLRIGGGLTGLCGNAFQQGSAAMLSNQPHQRSALLRLPQSRSAAASALQTQFQHWHYIPLASPAPENVVWLPDALIPRFDSS